MLQNTPTFADRVKGSSKSNLKRPTCLNFRTKANLKRHEVIDLLKEINFEPQKLEGVAETIAEDRHNLQNKTRHFTAL